jgi:hypothetical protein
MKSDKPFQKGFICGCALFAFILFLVLVLIRRQEVYFVKYFRVFIVSLAPTMLAAIWCFFSRKNWTWLRFIIVTMILCPLSLAFFILLENFLPEERPGLPTITFSPEISSSWSIERERPITDTAGKPVGSQMILKNMDRKRVIWVEACNSYDDFDDNVTRWRDLITRRATEADFRLREHTFALETKRGLKVATLHLRAQKDSLTRDIICEGWMQKRFFITCEAMGENIEIAGNSEIANIISSVVVK